MKNPDRIPPPDGKYKRKLEIIAAAQRNKLSPAEVIVWTALKYYGFQWQHVLMPFVVDFYSERRKLVIEVDGKFHAGQLEQDEERNRVLIECYGVRIYRLRAVDCFNGFHHRKLKHLLHIIDFQAKS